MNRDYVLRAFRPAVLTCALLTLGNCAHAVQRGRDEVWSPDRAECPAVSSGHSIEARLSDSAEPLGYDLRLEVDPNQDTFSATVHLSVRIRRPTCSVELHAKDLTISRAVWEDAYGAQTVLQVTPQSEHERIFLTGPGFFLPQVARLTLTYTGKLGSDKSGLYRVRVGDDAYLFTQMEPVSARRVLPCFDEPAYKVPLTLSVVVPDSTTVISNEEPFGEQTQGNGTKLVAFGRTKPLPTYLFALAVGPFESRSRTLEASAHRPAPLKIQALAPRGQGANLESALSRAAKLVPAMEHFFAGPFPFSKLDLVAAPEFAANGMENAGAIFMRQWLLTLDPELATAEQKADQISVLAHELGHQWFGNEVTLAWWDDLWLNEGFATWFGYKMAEEIYPHGPFETINLMGNHSAMGADMLPSTRKIRQPCRDANDIFSAFDAITYRKGAALLGMMEYQVGAERFMRGIRAYANQYAYGSATSADFLRVMRQQSLGPELVESLRDFLDRPGVPEISYRLSCDANKPMLHLSQKRYAEKGTFSGPEPAWQVPVCWRLLYPQADTTKGVLAEETCALLAAVDGEMRLPLSRGCPRSIVPNADGVGYYISHIPKQTFAGLDAKSLRPTEKASLMHDVEAGLFSGKIDFNDAQMRTQLVLSDPSWPALGSVFRVWRLALDALPSYERKNLQEGVFLRPHRERLSKFLFSEDVKSQASLVGPAHAQIARFLWREMDDTRTLKKLLKEGEKLLCTREIENSLSRELAPLEIAAAIERNPQRNFEKAWAVSRDKHVAEDMRAACLQGMAQVITPLAQDMLLTKLSDPTLSDAEILVLITGQFEEGRGRARFWKFFIPQAPALLKRMSGWGARNLIALSGWMTTEAQADEASMTFGPWVSEVSGGAQALNHALEAIRGRARVLAPLLEEKFNSKHKRQPAPAKEASSTVQKK